MINIDLHITYRCNLNCIHCSVSDLRNEDFIKLHYGAGIFRGKKPKEVIYKEEYILYLLSLLNDGKYKFRVNFSSNAGESTLIKNFVDIWNFISKKETVKSMTLTTNGRNLYKIIKHMDLTKLQNIIFSLDGCEEKINDTIRGPGSFNAVIRSIKAIQKIFDYQKNDNIFIQINYTLNKLNAFSLPFLPIILKYTHIPFTFNIIKIYLLEGNAAKNKKILNISFDEIKNSIKKFYNNLAEINVLRESKGLKPFKFRLEGFTAKEIFSIINNLHHLKCKYFLLGISRNQGTCGVVNKKRIFIDPYGYIFPCLQFTHEKVLNSFYEKYKRTEVPHISKISKIDDVIYSEFFRNARMWVNELYSFNGFPCAKCKFVKVCTICPVGVNIRGEIPNECRM